MRRATETDSRRLRSRVVAVLDLMDLESSCQCTEGFALNEQGDLEPVKACRTRLDHALRVARQAAGVGNGHGERTKGGATPNPVLAAVVAQAKADGTWRPHMGPDWWYDTFLNHVGVVNTAAGNLAVLCAELAKITTTDPKDLGKNGQGTCPACDSFCSGAHNDRLVSGMCDTDYRAWVRAGRPDRFEFIRARRGEIVA